MAVGFLQSIEILREPDSPLVKAARQRLREWGDRYPGRQWFIRQDGEEFVVSLYRRAAGRLIELRGSDLNELSKRALLRALKLGI